MYVAGIDIGHYAAKAVIMSQNREIMATAVMTVADEASSVAKQVLDVALVKTGLDLEEISAVVTTGVGRDGSFNTKRAVSEIACAAKGALQMFPSARTVLDIGAESVRSVECDEIGGVRNFALNDKCASGAGIFIEMMAKVLELPIEELGRRASLSQNEVAINATCAVFAESEVVSLIHNRVPVVDIARGVLASVASRGASLMTRVGMIEDIVLIGGPAQSPEFVSILSKQAGKPVFVPEDPLIIGALGAAIFALEDAQ